MEATSSVWPETMLTSEVDKETEKSEISNGVNWCTGGMVKIVSVESSFDGEDTRSSDCTVFFLDQNDDFRERGAGGSLGDVRSNAASFPFPLVSGLIRLRNEVAVNESPRLRRSITSAPLVEFSCVSDVCRDWRRCELLTLRMIEGEVTLGDTGASGGMNAIVFVSLVREVDAWGRPNPRAA